jgi:hypothetical protein
MVNVSYENRLLTWKEFRDTLCNETDPLESVVNFWNNIPEDPRSIDPYDKETWPSPWELIEENSYCKYTKILAIAYTMLLSECCQDWHYEIKVGLDKTNSELYYILIANDRVIGLDPDEIMYVDDIPNSINFEQSHVLSDRF